MSKVIILETSEGLDIITPIGPLDKVIARAIPEGASYEVIESDLIPEDRTFRAAWRKGSGKVDIDMPHARSIHMDKIRIARDKKLADLDIEYMRADESNNGQLKVDIARQKQTLRDIPTSFDLSSAESPEELLSLWPVELG